VVGCPSHSHCLQVLQSHTQHQADLTHGDALALGSIHLSASELKYKQLSKHTESIAIAYTTHVLAVIVGQVLLV